MRLYGLWKFPAMRLLFAVVQGLLCMTVCGLLLAGLLLAADVSAPLLAKLTALLWCVGGFAAGFVCGKHARRHGIWQGICCGAVLSLLLLSGTVLLHDAVSMRTWMRCLLLTAAAMTGGIIGVNLRITKVPY